MDTLQEHPRRTQVPEFTKEKRASITKWHALTLGLVLLVVVQALFVSVLYEKTQDSSLPSYESLYADYLSLQSQLETLKEQYDRLNSEYVSLKASYDELNSSQASDFESQYLSLQSRYDELASKYASLNSQYLSLKSSYDGLDSSYDLLNSQYLSLQSQFADLQDSYDSVASDYYKIQYQLNHRSQHYDIDLFITPNDTSVQQAINQITGGWSDPSDWDEYWTDIKALYDWVVNNIAYDYDGLFPVLPSTLSGDVEYTTEMWQFPNETLSLERGDCEDMAILLCSLVRGYSQEYWTECILIASSSAGHASVQIPVSGGKLSILDPAGNYYTSNFLGNLVSKDISTEINSWLNYWKSQMGSDVRVYRVFSDYMDQSFSSTSEYTSWMYDR
jgi:hypothetical protein